MCGELLIFRRNQQFATHTYPAAAAAGRGYTKFVGRLREMEALKHAADQAKAGHGQIAAVMGEPGVGKSQGGRRLYRGAGIGLKRKFRSQ